MKKILFQKQILCIYTAALLVMLLCPGSYANAGTGEPDTLRQITMDEVVITANRYNQQLINTGASVDVLRAGEINLLPAQNFTGILSYLPGIYATSTDGMGLNPQISIRGFYGGGEAEYLTVMVDGIPANELESGLANWNQIPLNEISRIELLRGGSSTIYGDAAMGGVINIRTTGAGKPFTRANIGYGSYNSYEVGAAHGGKLGTGSYDLYANHTATDGFRDHATWSTINFGGKLKLPISRRSTLNFSTFNQILSADDPGFLFQQHIDTNRTASLPQFRADGQEMQKYLVYLGLNSRISAATDLNIGLSYQHKSTEKTRTFAQIPNVLVPVGEGFYPAGLYDTTAYGDTKKRNLDTDQLNLAIRIKNEIPDAGARITGGIEGGYGSYNSEYADIFRGFENDYRNNYTPWDSLDTRGDGYRFTVAAYINGEIRLAEPLTLLAGLRWDLISDKYNGKVPDTSINKTNSALSPKIALNLSTGKTDNYSGSIFVSYAHAFKAPTIDQRTDLKNLNYFMFMQAGPSLIPIQIKADPFANADLKPQTSYNYEIGTYHYYKFSENFTGEISLAGYLIKVKDEIDFDLMTQKYKNIIDTEHTGLETSIKINLRKVWSGFVNYNYTQVEFSSGENEGKSLKGIPENVISAGIAYAPETGFGASLLLDSAGKIYLDDQNLATLDGRTILSSRLHYNLRFVTFYIDIKNIFDTSYNGTGYALDGVNYLYPAAGRMFFGGLNFSF
ncbi:MAG: TonB-dependent receptor [Bacteroidales bacterium]|nr:TonB-dependent receptor [Bacteroidales bacterium]NLO52329.1 TonB-dependent receptor [Bacteroidales bacterium]